MSFHQGVVLAAEGRVCTGPRGHCHSTKPLASQEDRAGTGATGPGEMLPHLAPPGQQHLWGVLELPFSPHRSWRRRQLRLPGRLLVWLWAGPGHRCCTWPSERRRPGPSRCSCSSSTLTRSNTREKVCLGWGGRGTGWGAGSPPCRWAARGSEAAITCDYLYVAQLWLLPVGPDPQLSMEGALGPVLPSLPSAAEAKGALGRRPCGGCAAHHGRVQVGTELPAVPPGAAVSAVHRGLRGPAERAGRVRERCQATAEPAQGTL